MGQISHRPFKDSARPEFSIVVPFFNEADNVLEFHQRISATMRSLGSSYELVFVDDGSRDATPRLLDDLQADDPRLVLVRLTRNFGHQAAISAGLDLARGRAVVVMDGDLQDPPEVVEQLIQAWHEGHDVVYAIRTKRKEGLLKRFAYATFYRVLRAVSDIDIPLDSGDFCLMDRRAVNALKDLPERQRFVRGLRSFVGFRQIGIRYERAARHAGEPKYTWRALLRLAVDGLVSFSGFPLNVITYLGLVSAVISVLFTFGVLTVCCAQRTLPAGWAATILAVLYLGTIHLISLGIMSEYVRRIFIEAKGRPPYIVRDVRRADGDQILRFRQPRRGRRRPSPAA